MNISIRWSYALSKNQMLPHVILLCTLYFLIFNSAYSKVPEIDISDLSKNSTYIAKGKISSCKVSRGFEICNLDLLKTYKGTGLAKSFCVKGKESNSEMPKLGKLLGSEVIVFLSAADNCFSVYKGYRGLVPLREDEAYVGVIANLPDKMATKDFESLIIVP